MMPKHSYNTELAFYAADSGLARAKEILKNCPDWDPDKCCSGTGSCCSTFGEYKSDGAGHCYLYEYYNIGSKKLYYKIYKSGSGTKPVITVDSGLVTLSTP